MTLGERLRQARLEAGLSQRQLCEDTITRNQLSQLEHDRSVPSLETLSVLARRLGRPMSYFLGETASPNLAVLEQVRSLWDTPCQGLDALEGYQPEGTVLDDLAALLEARLCLAAAREEPKAAPELIARGLAANRRSRLEDPAILGQAALLSGEPEAAAPVLRLLAEHRLAQREPQAALSLLEAGGLDAPELLGRVLYALGRYQEALQAFTQAEANEGSSQALLLQMEACCREMGDFQAAYGFAMRIRREFG